jgi:hypothetical protein
LILYSQNWKLEVIWAYSDYIIGRTEQLMVDTSSKLKYGASKFGILLNENKKKYMECTRKQVRGNKLEIYTMSLQSVQYL